MPPKEKTDYKRLIRELNRSGPGGLWLLWGDEEYLLESFFEEIKKLCFPGGGDAFNHKRFAGPLDFREISVAIDTAPLFSEFSLLEIRGIDINRLKEADSKAFRAIVSDLPDYISLVLIPGPGFVPDGRLTVIKEIKKFGRAIELTAQSQALLVNWVVRRAAGQSKTISAHTAEHLIFTCGGYMNRLASEIDKLCSYAAGNEITARDIDKVVIRLPEADIFNMTQRLSSRDYDGAASILADLFQMREPPIMLLAVIGQQFRRLYAARLALDNGLGEDFLREVTGIRFDFLLKKLSSSAKGFSAKSLRGAVRLCAETDYAMKSTSASGETLLKDLILRLSAGAKND